MAEKKVQVKEAPKEAKDARKWHWVNAEGQVLGRLAVRLATIISGKHKASYERHKDQGDFVVVVNADKVRVTGKKAEAKIYKHYSGYQGGLAEKNYSRVLKNKPTYPLKHAVQGMLPKSSLGNHMLEKLKVYAGPDHPHKAQRPVELKI